MIKQPSRGRPDMHLLQKSIGKMGQNATVNLGSPKGARQSRFKLQFKTQKVVLASFDLKTDRSPMFSLKESITVRKMPLLSQRISTLQPLSSTKARLESFQFPTERKTFTRKSLKTSSVISERKNYKMKNSSSNNSSPKPSIKKTFTTSFKINFPQMPRQSKTQEKVSIKEALRNSDWANRAKPELEKIWRNMINKSNGIERPLKTGSQYKFYIGKGNNSRLIRKLLASRSWWTEVDNMNEANFIWTQWKNKDLLGRLEYGDDIKIDKALVELGHLLCPIDIKVDTGPARGVSLDELGFQTIRNSGSYIQLEIKQLASPFIQIFNKLECNQHLTNKKGLYLSMLSFYKAMKENPFDYIPMTFHIQHGENDAEFIKFATMFSEIEKTKQPENMHNLWIIKPGENSNRGQGISVCNNLYQIKSLVSTSAYGDKTFIIQKYIEKPFLIHKRKFDFRCYSLITSINGVIQGYFYSDGYIRTASCEFSVKDTSNNFMHLTNDAIQKHCEDYGKFEDGNKLSYKDFQRYLDFHCSERKINFIKDVLPQIKKLTKDTMKAVYFKIDPNRRIHCMEVFGYDFMLDKNAKVWLIEVNTNPCLELSSNYLSILIPAMVENAFKIVLDPLFPPPFGKVGDVLIDNKFELIFHQATDAEEMINELGDRINLLQEENQISEEEEELFSDEDFDMGLNK